MKQTILLFIAIILNANLIAQENSNPNDTLESKSTLNVYLKEAEPFIIKNEAGGYYGLSVWLLDKLSKEVGFEFNLKSAELSDVLDKLSTSECDLSINPLTITSERIKSFDFSQPFYVSHSAIAVKNDEYGKMLGTVKKFFSLDFLKVVILLSVVIFVFGFITWLFERKKNDEFGEGWSGLWDGMWWSAVTMTTVGYGDKSPKTTGGRIMGLIWMFTAIIIISGFTASIAASLTVNTLSDKLQNINELESFSNGTIGYTATASYLENHNISYDEYFSVQEGISDLNDDKIETFIYDEPILKYLLKQSSYKDLQVLPIKFNQQFYGFGFPKGSWFEDKLNAAMLKITESSEWNEQLKKYGLGKF